MRASVVLTFPSSVCCVLFIHSFSLPNPILFFFLRVLALTLRQACVRVTLETQTSTVAF